ncbi:MAG: 16S rRNA (cytidine(1402)-2'-O)-methyltransferase [Candidatus Sericytochromatia bacterium]|nr:16S rRNA (cytidine(1402)-2'-O)-methyltransferase [Candidatus Sericytochromatia bacterium]
MSDYVEQGVLYICGTPIGNLEDITLRALRILKEVDFIACEDTRQTIKLINHYQISTKLISYHEHNEHKRAEEIIHLLLNNKNIALVSDAGTPLISDPGNILIQKAIENKIKIIPISGPSAFLLSIISSGFDLSSFVYNGFFSREKNKRKIEISLLLKEKKTSVYYESPHRIIETLKDIQHILGKRKVCIGREITKKFEEFITKDVEEIIHHFQLNTPKGEFCLVIQGAEDIKEIFDPNKFEERVNDLNLKNYTKKEISKTLALEFNLSSKEIYSKLIQKVDNL